MTVRALRPLAATVTVVLPDGRRFPAGARARGRVRGHAAGRQDVPDYRLAVDLPERRRRPGRRVRDRRPVPVPAHAGRDGPAPDRRGPARGAVAGARRARPQPFGEVTGTAFAVWAPNARGVRVIGDFNHWDGRAHPMRSLGCAGVWELFVPGVAGGHQVQVRDLRAGRAVAAQGRPDGQPWPSSPPATASVVFDVAATSGRTRTGWPARAEADPLREPMSVYEVHLGSWRPGLSYPELADQLTAYVTELGFTHVEFLPVAEHPFGGSWGYQVTSYYAPTARFGTPDEFRYLVDRLHQAGHRGDPRLGARALPARRLGAGPVRRHAAVRAPRPAPRRAPGLGHADLRLRPLRGAQLPGRQRALLAGGVPRRRPAGRRGGLDALPGLLPQGRRVDAERARRPGEPGRGRVPAGGQRDLLQAGPRHHDDRRGVHRVAGRDPAGAPGRARLRPEVEPRLDARHAQLPAARPGVPAATTTTS